MEGGENTMQHRKKRKMSESDFNQIKTLLVNLKLSYPQVAQVLGWSRSLVALVGVHSDYASYRAMREKKWKAVQEKLAASGATTPSKTAEVKGSGEVEAPTFHTDIKEIVAALTLIAEQLEKNNKTTQSLYNFVVSLSDEKKRRLFGL